MDIDLQFISLWFGYHLLYLIHPTAKAWLIQSRPLATKRKRRPREIKNRSLLPAFLFTFFRLTQRHTDYTNTQLINILTLILHFPTTTRFTLVCTFPNAGSPISFSEAYAYYITSWPSPPKAALTLLQFLLISPRRPVKGLILPMLIMDWRNSLKKVPSLAANLLTMGMVSAPGVDNSSWSLWRSPFPAWRLV